LVRQADKLSRAGKKGEALVLVEQALALNAAEGEALVLKARILLDQGKNDDALSACESAIAGSSNNAVAWSIKGMIHYERGQSQLAKSALQKYLELRPRAKDRDRVQAIVDSL
ncbi:MAG: tetratricopeptide repeat protein, partial [Pseudomonadota bacterium]